MTLPYRIGFCPCCSCQILSRNEIRKWVSKRPNYREINIYFPGGKKLVSAICEGCLKNPNHEELVKAFLMAGSQGASESIRGIVKEWGCPEGSSEKAMRKIGD